MRTAAIEGRRSARELAEAEGFRVEDHHAVTADGFVLVLHRVLVPSNGVSQYEQNATLAVVPSGARRVAPHPPSLVATWGIVIYAVT